MNYTPLTRDCAIVGIIGLLVAACGGFLSISFRDVTLTSDEAWNLGIAPLYVFFGSLLMVMSVLAHRGVRWVRWPIVFWWPATMAGIGLLAIHFGIEVMTWFDLLPLSLLSAIWIYGALKAMFGK